MTQYSTLTLVPSLQYGVPSDHYTGGNIYIGNAIPAANYYGGQGYIQTLISNIDSFQGNIIVQATLNDLQDSAPWFEIHKIVAANETTQITSNTVVGNFTWLRATVTDFVAGNINAITASY
jgi:hypothetical protein